MARKEAGSGGEFSGSHGSIGGSEGIKWTESGSRRMIAYLSFSDIVAEYGPASIWVALVQGDAAAKILNPETMPPINFICGPDPRSYQP